MKRMFFIYNPMAGKEQIKNHLSQIIQIFCRAGFEVTIYATKGKDDAKDMVANVGGEYDYLVCSGGDGTMNEVVCGLTKLERKPICGYIPAGTVNDFASSLKIPKIMEEAAELITKGQVFSCDLGQFNENYFTYVSGFGAFTEVSYQTPQEWKNALGKAAYFIEAMKHIAEIKAHHMVIEYDGEKIEDNFMLGIISNSVSVAGYDAYSKKDIMMDDGKFEVMFIKELRNPIEVQQALGALMTKNFDSDRMLQFSTSNIRIHSKDEVQWTLDGEDGGSWKDVMVVNHQTALQILCDEEVANMVSVGNKRM